MGEFLAAFETLFIVVHWISAVALISVILLQAGKGMDIGSMFGAGSSQSLFGARGASNMLTKMTTVTAIVFLLTSLSLATIFNYNETGGASSVIKKPTQEETLAVDPVEKSDVKDTTDPTDTQTEPKEDSEN